MALYDSDGDGKLDLRRLYRRGEDDPYRCEKIEIGCGPGAAAREIAPRIEDGHVLAIDRSAKAVAQARSACAAEIASGRLFIDGGDPLREVDLAS